MSTINIASFGETYVTRKGLTKFIILNMPMELNVF